VHRAKRIEHPPGKRAQAKVEGPRHPIAVTREKLPGGLPIVVMAGRGPAIHGFMAVAAGKPWMAGTRPAMTTMVTTMQPVSSSAGRPVAGEELAMTGGGLRLHHRQAAGHADRLAGHVSCIVRQQERDIPA